MPVERELFSYWLKGLGVKPRCRCRLFRRTKVKMLSSLTRLHPLVAEKKIFLCASFSACWCLTRKTASVDSKSLLASEKELVELALAGNQRAFAQLVGAYKQMVFRTAMGFLHNEDDAADLAQEVFVQLFRSLAEFRGDARLSTWLYRITVNRALNELRNRNSRSWLNRLSQFWEAEPEKLPVSASERADDLLLNNERAHILHRAIDSLPENQRTAFVLNKFDELSYAEIAEVMQLSIPSVESLLHRAKKSLQTKLIYFYKK